MRTGMSALAMVSVLVALSRAQSPEPGTVTLKVSGMVCSACADVVTQAAKKIDGVMTAKVALGTATAEVAFDPRKTSATAIARLLTEKSGFKTQVAAAQPDAAAKTFEHSEAIRVALAADHIKEVSKHTAALVPVFEKARLDGVHIFTCSMVDQSWAQKGKDLQNPYYGKSMLTCGVPKK